MRGNTRCRRPRTRESRDHPRMRGEHVPAHGGLLEFRGSSPHARGTRVGQRFGEHITGIIPACAGNTKRRHCYPPVTRDHPRMRGEHHVAHDRDVTLLGSSPHARGTRTNRGATPPRTGSSPHARGTPSTARPGHAYVGIIPACAGNTESLTLILIGRRDHPRMRGEHRIGLDDADTVAGSSPHARGTRTPMMFRLNRIRIIPACAGNTLLFGGVGCGKRDHPRMRGEHSLDGDRPDIPTGSSPHARGTPGTNRLRSHKAGIIPACAGNTSIAACWISTIWDHPRMRGEHLYHKSSIITHKGSSPHARGTRFASCRAAVETGIIPACAGNTRV